MRSRCLANLLVACGSGNAPAVDAPIADVAAEPDAATAIDADVPDNCPNRTALVGMPGTTPASDEIFVGDITIRNQFDVAALVGKKLVSGNLVIETATVANVSLPDLEVVTGSILVRKDAGSPLEVVEMPKLETTGGRIGHVSALSMTAYRMPRLEDVGGAVGLQLRASEIDVRCLREASSARFFDHAGSSLPLPKLAGGNLEILNAPNLTTLELPRFVSGSLAIGDSTDFAPSLTSISAPQLANATSVLIRAPELTTITFPASVRIGGIDLANVAISNLAWLGQSSGQFEMFLTALPNLTSLNGIPASIFAAHIANCSSLVDASALANATNMRFLTVLGNPALAELDLANLESLVDELFVKNNGALTRLVAPMLVSVSDVNDSVIENNPVLPTACATAIRDQVQANNPNQTFRISGNGTGVCP